MLDLNDFDKIIVYTFPKVGCSSLHTTFLKILKNIVIKVKEILLDYINNTNFRSIYLLGKRKEY